MSSSPKSSENAKRIEEIMEASFEKNRLKWLSEHEFNEDGNTFIISGETYSIKDDLKAAGFRYHPDLSWHKSQPVGYEDRLVKINIDEIAEKSAWGEYHFLSNIKSIIWKKTHAEDASTNSSEWIGEIGERVPALTVKLINKRVFQSRYGLQNIYTFETEKENILVWFTSCEINKEIDDWFPLTFKIKGHDIYKDRKQTVITRAKIEENN